jgi:hypothetical protein
LALTGNDDIEAQAMGLATTVTNRLKAQNESVATTIEDMTNSYADRL